MVPQLFIISSINLERLPPYTPPVITGRGSSVSPWCIGEFRWGYFYRRSISRNKHLALCVSKLFHKVNSSSGSDTSPNFTPTVPEFSTKFSTPVLQMRGGEDEMSMPEDITRLLICPLISPLRSPFHSSSLLSCVPFQSLLLFVVCRPQVFLQFPRSEL